MRDGPMNSSAGLTLGARAFEPRAHAQAAPDELLAGRGDAASFAELYERYLPTVYRYVAARVSAREEAEDVTSDVFRQMWTSRHAYAGLGAFRAWLFSIVRRTLADHYRHRRPAAPLAPGVAEQVPDDTPTPEDHVIEGERVRYATLLLSQLREEQQEILCLRFVAELTYAEISIVIGKREDAVKKIAYRTLQFLRERNSHA